MQLLFCVATKNVFFFSKNMPHICPKGVDQMLFIFFHLVLKFSGNLDQLSTE